MAVRDRETFPEGCQSWSGAHTFAEALVASFAIERHLNGQPLEWTTTLQHDITELLAIGVYVGALQDVSRSTGLKAILDLSDSYGAAILERAQILRLQGILTDTTALASLKLLHEQFISDPAGMGLVIASASLVVFTSPGIGSSLDVDPEIRAIAAQHAPMENPEDPASFVSFATSGWEGPTLIGGDQTWKLPTGGSVSIMHLTPGRSIVPFAHSLEELLLPHQDQLHLLGGALLEFRPVRLPGMRALCTIGRIPQTHHGVVERMGYVGNLFIPYERIAILIRVAEAENDHVGIREQTIRDELHIGDVKRSSKKEWLLPHQPPGIEANRSEDPMYDSAFPDHPLTHVRTVLTSIRHTIQLDTRLIALETPIPLPDV